MNYFIDEFNNERKKNKKLSKLEFSTECIKYLKSLDWPGNVRELKNTVQRVVITRLIKENRLKITKIEISKYIHKVPSTKTESSKKGKKKELTPENVEQALINNNGIVTHAAKEMGYSRGYFSIVYNKMLRDDKSPPNS